MYIRHRATSATTQVTWIY